MTDRCCLPLDALRAFEAVGHNLGFPDAAAWGRSVSQGAVSRLPLRPSRGLNVSLRPVSTMPA